MHQPTTRLCGKRQFGTHILVSLLLLLCCLHTGCGGQLYRCAQTKWTLRLAVQMTLYVGFILVSMGAGGGMPWLLQRFRDWDTRAGMTLKAKVYIEEPGYSYINNNTYSYCSDKVVSVTGKLHFLTT